MSISPKGSDIDIGLSLPARLGHAGDQALVGQFPQHDARKLELAVIGTRTAGQLAAVAHPGRVRIARQLGHEDQFLGKFEAGQSLRDMALYRVQIGRAITGADDPREAAIRIAADIERGA